jgi:hypothetical protein
LAMSVLNTKQFTVRLFLLIIACFLVSIAEGTAKTKKHYNVILIMADDSAVDNYGCYGSTFFTPPDWMRWRVLEPSSTTAILSRFVLPVG